MLIYRRSEQMNAFLLKVGGWEVAEVQAETLAHTF
jgi:hypothetical protein